MSAAFPRTLSEYCERTAAGFWAEPFNAVSNAAFLLAALLAYVIWRREAARDWPVFLLVLVVFAIAIGSFLFHTRPGPRTVLMDVVPIQCFVVGYLVLALRRFVGAPWWLIAVAILALFGASILIGGMARPEIAGTLGYVPALAAQFAIGLILVGKAQAAAAGLGRAADAAGQARRGLQAAFAGRSLLLAAVVFLVSLTLRMLDRSLCSQWPIGTHFLWHLCNALVLFILLRTALFHPAAAARIEAAMGEEGR